jgi:hypothetical protein
MRPPYHSDKINQNNINWEKLFKKRTTKPQTIKAVISPLRISISVIEEQEEQEVTTKRLLCTNESNNHFYLFLSAQVLYWCTIL